MKVIVIGAGVVGLAIAGGLAERGASVTVLEKARPGSGTSSTSYAWINANNKTPRDYYELNLAGLEAHQADTDGHGSWFFPSGHIEIATGAAHGSLLNERIGRLKEYGYPVQRLTVAEARSLEPSLHIDGEPYTIAYYPREGYCYVPGFLEHLKAKLESLGGSLREETQAVRMTRSAAGVEVTLSDASAVTADVVVLAAGRWTQRLLDALRPGWPDLANVPLVRPTEKGSAVLGFLAITSPVAVDVRHLITTSSLNLRPYGDTRLLLQALDLDVDTDAAAGAPSASSGLAAQFLARLRTTIPAAGGAGLQELQLGKRVLPLDGKTVAGWVEPSRRTYAVATHSGMTLSTLLGKIVPAEVFGEESPLLRAFRPDRFRVAAPPGAVAAPRLPGDQ